MSASKLQAQDKDNSHFFRDKTGRFPFGRGLLQGLSLGGKAGFQFCVVHGVIPPCVHIALTEKRR